jgi:hypothetical protein
MAQFDFNARNVAPATGGANQLPVSDSKGHVVVITESEVIPTNNDPENGQLVMLLKVVEGEHVGVEGKYRLQIFHKDKTTNDIAWSKFSAICHAVNVFDFKNTGNSGVPEIHNIPFRVVVSLQKSEENAAKGYTEVKYVLAADGSAPGKAKPAAAPVAPVPPPVAPVAPIAPAVAPAWGTPVAPAAPAEAPVASSTPPWATK